MKRPMTGQSGWLGLLLALAAWTTSVEAKAGLCKDLPGAVIGLGGSAQKPVLAKVATALAGLTPAQTLVYQSPGACFGINGLIAGTKVKGTGSYWDTTGKEFQCTFDDVNGGDAFDFASMGNSATLCPDVASLPSGFGDFLGPVQAFNFIVPKASSQVSISSEAAYFVFGFGALGGVTPWNVDNQIFRRDPNSAVQLFVGRATGVPADKFKGTDTKNNAGTLSAVAGSATPENAIGIVSGEVADGSRESVNSLAYQHKGQSCGYWPDSSPTSFDKRNVRSGQYWIWSAMHFFAKTGPDGKPSDPKVAKLIGYFTGDVAPPATVNMLELEIRSSTIPKCAMEVWRDGDLSDLKSYAPAEPCGCYFESVATGATTCSACTDDSTCSAGAPHCRYGFCEVN